MRKLEEIRALFFGVSIVPKGDLVTPQKIFSLKVRYWGRKDGGLTDMFTGTSFNLVLESFLSKHLLSAGPSERLPGETESEFIHRLVWPPKQSA